MYEQIEVTSVREPSDKSSSALFQSVLEANTNYLEYSITGSSEELPSLEIEELATKELRESTENPSKKPPKRPVKPTEQGEGNPKLPPASGLSPCQQLQAEGFKIGCPPSDSKREIINQLHQEHESDTDRSSKPKRVIRK